MLWRHHCKTKQMFAALNCWGVQQGAAFCFGAHGVVLNSEITVV
jgi:hypothetical protein